MWKDFKSKIENCKPIFSLHNFQNKGANPAYRQNKGIGSNTMKHTQSCVLTVATKDQCAAICCHLTAVSHLKNSIQAVLSR
jgi:5,10-methylenetetrahydrofolate reductase